MKAVCKRLPLLVPFLFAFHAPIAAAWTTHISCQGPIGTHMLQGGAGEFTSAFTNTIYSNSVIDAGQDTCQMGITAGSTGWGTWGGTYNFPTHLGVGAQLWIRLSLFVPVGFNYTASPWLKFIRVHTTSPAVSNEGYMDFVINPPSGTVWDYATKSASTAPFSYMYEGKLIPHTVGSRSQNAIVPGKWETFEIYYMMDTVSKADGGTGEVRIWQNNQLLADLTDQVTLANANTYANAFFLFTYWNGGSPATQSLYVNNITITNDTPTNHDANGNPCICAPMPGTQPNPPGGVAVR